MVHWLKMSLIGPVYMPSFWKKMSHLPFFVRIQQEDVEVGIPPVKLQYSKSAGFAKPVSFILARLVEIVRDLHSEHVLSVTYAMAAADALHIGEGAIFGNSLMRKHSLSHGPKLLILRVWKKTSLRNSRRYMKSCRLQTSDAEMGNSFACCELQAMVRCSSVARRAIYKGEKSQTSRYYLGEI